jgi:hypothetical protein
MEDFLHNGSNVTTKDMSGYINSSIFLLWLKEQFIPRKPIEKLVLLLDCYRSYCTDVDMLEMAQENGMIMVCLSSNSTSASRSPFLEITITFFLQRYTCLGTMSARSQSIKTTISTVAEGGMTEI